MPDYECIPEGSCTIDLNGHSLGSVSFAVQRETLTLKNYGAIDTLTLRSRAVRLSFRAENAPM